MFKNLIMGCLLIGMIILTSTTEVVAQSDNQNNYEIIVLVKLSEKRLFLFKNGVEIASYPVAVPKSNLYHRQTEGELIKIVVNPVWYPTEKTRNYYLKTKGVELPKIVPPADPRNAMGAAKLIIKFNGVSEPIRIHGTNDPNSISKRITRGCIRLHNKDILNLINLIKNQKVKVKIET